MTVSKLNFRALAGGVVVAACAMTLAFMLAGCGSGGAASTSSAGSELDEDYIAAYEDEAESNDVVECQVGEEFEANGVKYTVHEPSAVAPSETEEGVDSFKVDIDVDQSAVLEAAAEAPEEAAEGESASSTASEGAASAEVNNELLFFSPDGLYANDLIEAAERAEVHADASLAKDDEKYEAAIRAIDAKYDDQPQYTRTVEIAYEEDGTYTVEVRDFTNSKVYRVALAIAR